MLNKDELGFRIKTLRLQQRQTLEEIAGRCGLTKSMISKIENGRAMPSVSTLTNLAAVLGASVASLLEKSSGQRRIHTPAATSREKRVAVPEKGYAFFPFATERLDKSMQPFLFSAKKGEVVSKPLSHSGEEFIYILKGRLRYFVGEAQYLLGPGDSLYYDAQENHDLEPLSDTVEYLAVFGGSEEKTTTH